MRKICIVTGSRAEYGLLLPLIREVESCSEMILQTVVTGQHLTKDYGLTKSEIDRDRVMIAKEVDMSVAGDTSVEITKSVGHGIIGFADAFAELGPDIVVLLGDRFEILASATAALFQQIPIAHIHGGEVTVGAYDDSIRHSVTKMAFWHFVATNVYQKRVVQLGEDPERVFVVGGLGIDVICQTEIIQREELEKILDFSFGRRNLLVTYHPTTVSNKSVQEEITELLSALSRIENTSIVFTSPNLDKGSSEIREEIKHFCNRRPLTRKYFDSLGNTKYLSVMEISDAVVGNSSSGLLEAPTMKTSTVNIGGRQEGRIRADSVIDVPVDRTRIYEGISVALSGRFNDVVKNTVNPYGEGTATRSIVEKLRTVDVPETTAKRFWDLEKE